MKSIANKLFYSYIKKVKYEYISISCPQGYKNLNINLIKYQPRNKNEIEIEPKGHYEEPP